MTCQICGTDWEPRDKWGETNCPKCGQQYRYDEGPMIVLTDEQLNVLRALKRSAHTIDNVTEVYVFASNGFVNTCKRGEANTTQTRTTAEVELAVGQRMVIERGEGVLKVEVLP